MKGWSAINSVNSGVGAGWPEPTIIPVYYTTKSTPRSNPPSKPLTGPLRVLMPPLSLIFLHFLASLFWASLHRFPPHPIPLTTQYAKFGLILGAKSAKSGGPILQPNMPAVEWTFRGPILSPNMPSWEGLKVMSWKIINNFGFNRIIILKKDTHYY